LASHGLAHAFGCASQDNECVLHSASVVDCYFDSLSDPSQSEHGY
jgi:hypothetical protein